MIIIVIIRLSICRFCPNLSTFLQRETPGYDALSEVTQIYSEANYVELLISRCPMTHIYGKATHVGLWWHDAPCVGEVHAVAMQFVNPESVDA